MVYRSPSENKQSPPTQCQRMLRGMETIVKRVETLEKDHGRSKWAYVVLIVFLACITAYNVFQDLRNHPLFDAPPQTALTRQYVYDEQGRLEAQLEFNLNNELIWKRVFVYDENGNNTLCEDFNNQGVAVHRVESSFDESGNEIERTETDLLEKQTQQWTFTYNEKGAKIRALKNIVSPSTG